MPNAWQPDSISPITSQSWKKHQKLGEDHWSLRSMLDNEAGAVLHRGQLEKRMWQREWVRVGNGSIPPTCADSMMARNTAYTNSASASSCTESALSAKQRREEAGLGGAQEELWISFRANKTAPCTGEAIKEIS